LSAVLVRDILLALLGKLGTPPSIGAGELQDATKE
jgi:hypothetical protein